jgi:hypothetical protein
MLDDVLPVPVALEAPSLLFVRNPSVRLRQADLDAAERLLQRRGGVEITARTERGGEDAVLACGTNTIRSTVASAGGATPRLSVVYVAASLAATLSANVPGPARHARALHAITQSTAPATPAAQPGSAAAPAILNCIHAPFNAAVKRARVAVTAADTHNHEAPTPHTLRCLDVAQSEEFRVGAPAAPAHLAARSNAVEAETAAMRASMLCGPQGGCSALFVFVMLASMYAFIGFTNAMLLMWFMGGTPRSMWIVSGAAAFGGVIFALVQVLM